MAFPYSLFNNYLSKYKMYVKGKYTVVKSTWWSDSYTSGIRVCALCAGTVFREV